MMNNAFVTGGSRGIGRAIVLRYVKEGWGVGFTYASNAAAAEETVSLAKEINPAANLRAYQLDLADHGRIEEICDQVIDDFGDVTAVVNNAATLRDNAAALMSNEEWQKVIDVDLTAPFIVSRSFLLHFLSNRKGRLVHVSSLAAYGSSGQVNYAAAKAGLHGMSLTIAKEYGKKGITSNIVTVGFVPTDMTDDNMAHQLKEYWVKHCPARRVGTAEEIASAVYYLSSDEAGFITGEDLRVAAGLTYAP
jgi:3-oxoacyl-[acyl-carrier protein] reductase